MSQASQKLRASFDRRFVALSAAAVAGLGVAGIAEQAQAAIVYSGTVNLSVPANGIGRYLNVVTGATNTTGSFAGYDINPYATTSGASFFTSTTSSPAGTRGYVSGTTTGPVLALPAGTQIDATSIYAEGVASGAAFLPGVPTFFGFRFRNEGAANQTQFGWARISAPSTSTLGIAGTLIDYAYEDTGAGIAAGAGVPEPTALGLLAVGAVGLLRRRNQA